MFSSFSSYTAYALPLVAIVTYVVLVAAARPDHDHGRDGMYATYLGIVGVAALYAVLVFGATTGVAVGEQMLVNQSRASSSGITGDVDISSALAGFGGPTQSGDQQTQTIVLGGALTLGAAIVLVFHLRRRQELTADAGYEGSAAERVDRAYRATVALVVALLGISALAFLAYGVYALVDPGSVGADHSQVTDQAIVRVIVYGALLVVLVGLFHAHFWSIRENEDEDADVEARLDE